MMNTSKLLGRKALFLAVSVMALGASGTAFAAATSNLGVSATVTNNCTISSTPIGFGSYDPIVTHASSSSDADGSVTITCTLGADVDVTLGQGANADSGSDDTTPLRRMRVAATSNYLSYSLFSDAGRTVIWGNTEATGVADTGTGDAEVHTVYGRAPADQNVPAGSYSDTVVATVTF